MATESKASHEKQPRRVIFADHPQVRIKIQEQNALFVFLKKPKKEPETPYHRHFMALTPPDLKASIEIYEAELQYEHRSRPRAILRLPMEVMLDRTKINWCIVNDSTTKNQPMPDMSRELVVLYANSIRSETLGIRTALPNGATVTEYHTTLNKRDGTQEKIESLSIESPSPSSSSVFK